MRKRVGFGLILFILFLMIPHAASRSLDLKKTVGQHEVQIKMDRNPPIIGDNPIEIEIRGAGGKPVTDAKVFINYYMPPMPRMAPMNYVIDTKLKGEKYRAVMNFIMSGPWIIAVKITSGGKAFTAKFNVDAQ